MVYAFSFLEFSYAEQDTGGISFRESSSVIVAQMLNELTGNIGYLEEIEKKVIENVEGLEIHEVNGTNINSQFTSDKKTKYFLDYELNLKAFSFMGSGEHIEIWVADDLSYPEGDSRNADSISQKQLNRMKNHFEDVMDSLIMEKHALPHFHRGQNSWLVNQGYLPHDYYVTDTDKSKVILLVDNIKDKAYYDEDQSSYIPGYYWNVHRKYADRDIITINSKDWDLKFESVYMLTLVEELHRLMEDNVND